MSIGYKSVLFSKIGYNELKHNLQDSVPLRIKNIHIVNQPYIFKIVFNLFKPFLREKLRNRIIFHGSDRKSLQEHMSPKCLPECYGGTLNLPRINGVQWLELLLKCDKEYEGNFLACERRTVQEKYHEKIFFNFIVVIQII